jgi:predicted kinase
VASILAAEPSGVEGGGETPGAKARARAAAEAHRHFKLALASERPSLLEPLLIAVGGPIASGKSTIAEWIADQRSAPVVDTDRTRKSLLGVRPTEKVWHPPFEGGYAADVTGRVYDEVLRRAGAVLDSGRAVVLDASFRSRAERAAARRLAEEHGVGFLFVECAADTATLRRRLEERARHTGVSDGRLEILDAFLASWEAVTELAAHEHVRLDTDRAIEETRDALRARIAFWPPRLQG